MLPVNGEGNVSGDTTVRSPVVDKKSDVVFEEGLFRFQVKRRIKPDVKHCGMQGNSLAGTISDLNAEGTGFHPCRVGFQITYYTRGTTYYTRDFLNKMCFVLRKITKSSSENQLHALGDRGGRCQIEILKRCVDAEFCALQI